MKHVTVVQELGQPSLTIDIDRAKIARYGINVADINGLIEAAVGGRAATQVAQGERLFDLVVRLLPQYRETPEQIGNVLVATPDGQRVPLRELADIKLANGASFIYRQDNSRFIGVQYSVEGRDLAGAVQEAQRKVAAAVPLPDGLSRGVGRRVRGVHGVALAAAVHSAGDAALIFVILFALYNNFKFPFITVAGVVLSAPIGGAARARAHGHTVLGVVGHRVPRAVRRVGADGDRLHLVRERAAAEGQEIAEATSEAALLRLRPIMMTALVAALGLLPAALSSGVGSDSQTAVRARHRGWTLLAAAHQRLSHAGAVCCRGAGRGIGSRCNGATA